MFNDIIMDEEDRYLLHEHNFSFYKIGYIGESKRINGKTSTKFLHNFILPPKRGFIVDHINRNKLDNRRCNLRYVTYSQNNMNSSMQKNNTSGYRGVCWHKKAKKWACFIKLNKKRIHIGLFSNIEEAARAYKNKATELFGDYIGENQFA
jgi:hypothetical protein